jgi:arabinose-5-phosphate isomerase
LAKYADCHLNVSVRHEADPLDLAPTSSSIAQMAMGDALAVALIKKRNFKPQDFAQFHPGGELGKRLLTTAQDVMLTEHLPLLAADLRLGDAIILVSKGKLGLGVAMANDRIEGIITDGDIRRAMERWQKEFFNHTVGDIMTRSPKTVRKDTKISEIQQLMNKHKIHSVLVADEEAHLLGIVDRYACVL